MWKREREVGMRRQAEWAELRQKNNLPTVSCTTKFKDSVVDGVKDGQALSLFQNSAAPSSADIQTIGLLTQSDNCSCLLLH